MKTIALTFFAAALGLAQSTTTSSAPATSPAQQTAGKDTRSKDKGAKDKPSKDKSAKDAANTAAAAKNQKPALPAKVAPEPPPKPAPPLQVVPAGATMIEPNLYRYTDSNGKTWNYRKTPFGISKWEETSAPASPSSSPADQPQATQPSPSKGDPVLVTDLGDSYRFERKTPFGGSTWVRKKSELTDEERILTGQQPEAINKPAGN